jgi:hypothetical protein
MWLGIIEPEFKERYFAANATIWPEFRPKRTNEV